jgi:hypothetical protein
MLVRIAASRHCSAIRQLSGLLRRTGPHRHCCSQLVSGQSVAAVLRLNTAIQVVTAGTCAQKIREAIERKRLAIRAKPSPLLLFDA